MWKWGLDKLSVYGLLRAHSSKRVVAMLHRVMEAGLARQRDPDGVKFRPVVELTAAGIAVMKGEQPPPASLIDLAPGRGSRASGTNPRAMGTNPRALGSNPKAIRERSQPEPEDDYQPDPQAIQRFERLRAIRAQIAREKDLPAYCICHDSTLKLIARFAPDSLQKLEQIKGMGPHKVRAYGQQLLDAIKEANA
jgi:ATP-dependent DNA helicase RecQ